MSHSFNNIARETIMELKFGTWPAIWLGCDTNDRVAEVRNAGIAQGNAGDLRWSSELLSTWFAAQLDHETVYG